MTQFDAIENIKDDRIQEIVEASEDPKETIRQLSDQLSNRQRELEKEYWERCRFCECGAESILECECDREKKRRYMQRTSRKINKELGNSGATILMLKTEYRV